MLKVLFIHGLESGPNGTKAKTLASAGFDVASVDMQMSFLKLSKRNSVTRQLLRFPSLYLCAFLISLSFFGPLELIALVLLSVIAYFIRIALPKAWTRSLDACVKLQVEMIAEHQPDVVVGSSWGGAVTCELMRTGEWSGATILLASAHEKARSLMHRDKPSYYGAFSNFRASTIMFHDPSDDVVDVEGSDLLAEYIDCDYRRESGGGHSLIEVTRDGRLVDAVRRVAE